MVEGCRECLEWALKNVEQRSGRLMRSWQIEKRFIILLLILIKDVGIWLFYW